MSKKEEKIKRLNLVLRTIRNVNRILVKERDSERLLRKICQNLTENRGYHNAWIALFDKKMNFMKRAQSGLENKFDLMEKLFEKGRLTNCARKALASKGMIITENPLSECTDCPLSANYSGRAAMTVRLEFSGKVYGILTISSPKHFVHDKEEQELLGEIASDIAYALNRIEIEKEKVGTEKALRESEQGVRDIVDNSLVGIGIIQKHKVVYTNPEQLRLLGSHPSEEGPFDLEKAHPDDVDKVRTLYEDLISGKSRILETDFRFYPEGKKQNKAGMKWVYCRSSHTKYKGQPAILVNLLDITKSKELEHLLTIKDKMVSLGHVATGIAHEIRNPLSGINIYLNTLEKIIRKEDGSEEEIDIIQRAKSASDKIESVIRRVMDFSKPSEPKLILKDINESIKGALDLSSATLRKSGIELEVFLGDRLPLCYADPPLLEEVILNLITNAADAMKEKTDGKRIRFVSLKRQDRILLQVADSGPGIPPKIRSKVFDPFFTTKSDSTGIGLSISHRIITDHGGSIRIDSSDLGGAEFTIEIPIPKMGV